MAIIKDLTANQLADYANTIFIFSGRNQMGAKLIYRCLELEPEHPQGLRCLSDFLDWQGSEVYSAVVLEYLIEHKLGENQQELEDLLFLCKWVWGFSKHKKGNTNLSQEDFQEKENFIVDQEAYEEYIDQAIDIAASSSRVVQTAHKLIGVYGGIVHSPTLLPTHKPIDFLLFLDFEVTDEYQNYLTSGTEELENYVAKVNE